ncbi:hypothetical protein M3667_06475 [Microbacterium sp. P26]|uniref:hypothetical protein n=1 Tax=Microbacterium TaxID=33882 RepID=UPI00203E5D67|nr:hypothetical protein [Microbacterium sp. P26]MCM3501526.1 hypothetical protein [Microbacterium sp. P26]
MSTRPPRSEHISTPAHEPVRLSRRTLLAASAWSVPAIALTTSSPALAASGLTLSFDRTSYSGTGCSTIDGVTVSATDSATPVGGIVVTVMLSDGYTFAGGGTSATGTTGSNGVFALPDIAVPRDGGVSSITASASAAHSATASLVGSSGLFRYVEAGSVVTAQGVPSGSRPIAHSVFFSPDGRLIDGSTGATLSSNVDTVGQMIYAAGTWRMPIQKTDGTYVYLENGTELSTTGVLKGTPLGYSIFTSDFPTDGASGRILTQNVRQSGEVISNGVGVVFPVRNSDGATKWVTLQKATNGGSNFTPVAGRIFFTTFSSLIDGRADTTLANGVKSYGSAYSDGTHYRLPLEKTDGSFAYLQDDSEIAAVGVPAGSTPASSSFFLTSDNRLIDGASGGVLATGIDQLGKSAFNGSTSRTPFTLSLSSC